MRKLNQEVRLLEVKLKEKEQENKLTELKVKELRKQIPNTRLKPLNQRSVRGHHASQDVRLARHNNDP